MTRTAETNRLPRYGAYVIVPRDDDSGIFDWHQRDPEVVPARAQEILAGRIHEFQDELIESNLSPEREKMYLEHAQRIFNKGCVQQNPRTEIASEELNQLVTSFVIRDLSIRLASETRRYTILALILLVTSLVAAVFCRYFGKTEAFDGHAVSAYFVIWAASMAGIVVSNVAIPFVSKIADYQNQRRLLSDPLLRMLSVGFGSIAVALALENGGLTLKVGTLDLTKVEDSVGIASLVGFVCAFVGSDLVKTIVGFFRRGTSVEHQRTATAARQR